MTDRLAAPVKYGGSITSKKSCTPWHKRPKRSLIVGTAGSICPNNPMLSAPFAGEMEAVPQLLIRLGDVLLFGEN